MSDMRRREFLTLLGGAAAWPVGVRAQQATMPVVGFLSSVSAPHTAKRIASFAQGLSETSPATPWVGTSRSSSAWRKANMNDCLHLRPIW
jgi:hypothetical protein